MVLYILAESFCFGIVKNQNKLIGLNQMHAVDGIIFYDNNSCNSFSSEQVFQL